MDVVNKTVAVNAKQFSEPSTKNVAELLVAVECFPNTEISPGTRNYLKPLRNWRGVITWKTREDFLEEMILLFADDTPSRLSSNPTEKQRAAERKRRFNALTTRHRFVFSAWPRDPRSKHTFSPASKKNIVGKTAIKGLQLWGASLFDFHEVQTINGNSTISTSSRVLEFTKSIREDYGESRQMVKRAGREEDPRLIEPFDVGQLIQREEREIKAYMHAKRTGKVRNKGREGGEGKEKGEPTGYSGPYPIKSLFNPSCYPKGWIKEPFSGKDLFEGKLADTPPNLQQYLPQRLLPKKLIVHDPCGVLNVTRYRNSHYEDHLSEMTDITHTYTLNPSTQFTDRKREEDAAAENEAVNAKCLLKNFLSNPHSSSERPPGYEMAVQEPTPDGTVAKIYVVLPQVPLLRQAKEAHLYLARTKALGVGHHSCVYNAEFEVPRSLLVKEELCMDCVRADVMEQLGERAADLKNARPGKISTKGDIKKPLLIFGGNNTIYVFDAGGNDTKTGYVGPYDVVVQARVGYQNLERAPYCQHFRTQNNAVHPLTAKVSVAAKLSFPDDNHLQVEANNYHRFPKQLFEHWSGFGLIRHPVPLGPVVPQFYGYYVPKNKVASGSNKSPILLVEKCGEPISFKKLSIDDKQECTSLLRRFHKAGWTHGSTFERNILKQPGTLNASPDQRLGNSTDRGGYGVHWSFRLIDFGRSEFVGTGAYGASIKGEGIQIDHWEKGYVTNPFDFYS